MVAILLVEADKDKWRKHLQKENGKWVIYVSYDKAIYGMMNAALLAYKKLAKLFCEWGSVMNPYDPCVWNKMVGGKQMTIMFHIDDLLMAHLLPHIVTLFIKKLEREYATQDPLTVTRGLIHDYLGVTFDLCVPGQVALSQYDYLKKFYHGLPDNYKVGYKGNKYRCTPAPADLFKRNKNSPLPNDASRERYHGITAQALWLSQRLRPDLQLAVGYHCSSVKFPTDNDEDKLIWMIGNMWFTRFLPTIIAITEDDAIIYIYGSHAVHTDAKGHSAFRDIYDNG